jgi:hypothetical protein
MSRPAIVLAMEPSRTEHVLPEGLLQRLDTVGGVAPSEGCDEAHAGEEVRAPYEATYAFFYPAAMTATTSTLSRSLAPGQA